MKQILTTLVDDIDGGAADQTVLLALDGVSLELDLSNANADKLRKDMDKWIKPARRVGGRRTRAHTAKADQNQIRQWAAKNGFKVANRGRIKAEVVEAFNSSSVSAPLFKAAQ